MPSNSYEKPDYWSQKAFSEGYPARSVYKLKEIDEKFGMIKKGYPARSVYKLQEIDKKYGFIKKGIRILDLGSAPGSWTTFVIRQLEGTGHVTSIDLKPLAKNVKSDNLTFIQGDLYSEEIRKSAKDLGPYHLVICDAAPATTGNKVVDTARSSGLVELAIYYAETMLKPGGNFAVKIFQGGDQQMLLKKMREIFTEAKGFKPVACRTESFETYLIGINKK